MSLYSLIVENKYILEIFYALIICSICMLIVLKTDWFYKLSLHKGIRYFRNAFFFYGIAFGIRYILGVLSDFAIESSFIFVILFEYFIVMSGFFLFYSLVWKKIESPTEKYKSSLINPKIIIFHLMALIIAVTDFLWQTYDLMFFSQIIVFFCSFIIAVYNYVSNGKRYKFLKFYALAMFFSLVAWILNLLAALYFEWNKGVLINIGIINMTFFLLFLYGVIKVTQK